VPLLGFRALAFGGFSEQAILVASLPETGNHKHPMHSSLALREPCLCRHAMKPHLHRDHLFGFVDGLALLNRVGQSHYFGQELLPFR
jgi:hypothetical protein